MGTWQDRLWDTDSFTSRAPEPYDPPDSIFQAFVPHPITDWNPELDNQTAGKLSLAENALRNLDNEYGKGIAVPAEWLLRRAESGASSTIEGVFPSARRLARAEAKLNLFGEQPNLSDQEALRNIIAFELAMSIAGQDRPINIEDILAIHNALMGPNDPTAGKLRTTQNWIGSRHLSTPLNADYVPPPPELVPALMDDLIERINHGQGHALVEMAIVHAQFEIIHPFGDGNGRTGRALMQIMLQRGQPSISATLPISSALAVRREKYIDSLNKSRVICAPDDLKRSLAIRQWINLVGEAVADASPFAERLIQRVSYIQGVWNQKLRDAHIKEDTTTGRLLTHLPSNPVLNIKKAAELVDVSFKTGASILKALEKIGVLVQRSAGKRNRVYEAEAITGAYADSVRLGGSQFISS